ncbi:MAG TPA: hypothetical protein VLF87_01755 [Patescibacteria group bacterium]|nr:hypothetical protein [Patescibacteria group bacterium]
MIQKLVKSLINQRADEREAELYRNLIRHEAKIGANVFGPVPEGHRREFFCLDEMTWIWHEEWDDARGQTQVQTTRYDVRPDGILKSQHGHYQRVEAAEAQRLRKAVRIYLDRVNREMYQGAIRA